MGCSSCGSCFCNKATSCFERGIGLDSGIAPEQGLHNVSAVNGCGRAAFPSSGGQRDCYNAHYRIHWRDRRGRRHQVATREQHGFECSLVSSRRALMHRDVNRLFLLWLVSRLVGKERARVSAASQPRPWSCSTSRPRHRPRPRHSTTFPAAAVSAACDSAAIISAS